MAADQKAGAARLRGWLRRNQQIHARRLPAGTAAALEAVQRWQRERLARTYADFAEQPRHRRAVRFFLDDLYAPHNLLKRDADVARIFPVMVRLLPDEVLTTVSEAVELQVVSLRLDHAMARVLRSRLTTDSLTESVYATAYRQVGGRSLRARQIELVPAIGAELDELVRVPLIYGTLKMCQVPARLAGLGELQGFLERGFAAFRAMRGASEFIDAVVARECAAMEHMFAGGSEPFTTVSPAG